MAAAQADPLIYGSTSSCILPEPCPGFASLDSLQVQQTKQEIRSLVNEIADLANRKVEPIDFYRGLLARVCAAMGATGACVWNVTSASTFSLAAEHNLPTALKSSGGQPTEPHRRILECIFAEGSPVLVPPGSTSLEVQRPTNPLEDALLVVPVRTDENVDFLLEVIQRPSGGPVAQRGYLRFVAQIADLMADFLRRHSLRMFRGNQEYHDQFHRALVSIASRGSEKDRFQAVADALDELLLSQQSILLRKSYRFRVQSIGGVDSPDPRSETIALAQRVANKLFDSSIMPLGSSQPSSISENHLPGIPSPLAQFYPAQDEQLPKWRESDRQAAQRLSEILACDRLCLLALRPDRTLLALLPYDEHLPLQKLEARAIEFANACAPLLGQPESYLGRVLHRLKLRPNYPESLNTPDGSFYARIQRWIMRLSVAGLAIVIAVFPVPQQVTVTALLEPLEKQSYYAPTAALVDVVHVDQDSSVRRGDVLLELVDQQLQSQLDQLLGQQTETRSQIAQIQNTLSRNSQLPTMQRDQLEAEKEQLTIAASTLVAQLQILQNQLSEMRVVARQDGQIASWDVRNRLSDRPVQAGQLLLTTFRPDGPWRLQLSVPEYRVGLISQAIAANAGGAPMQFSLSSHPGETRQGRVTSLGSQSMRDSAGQTLVLASARIESETLPIKKDGAVARATIDCGRIPAVWLVLRDAILTISSRLKMIW